MYIVAWIVGLAVLISAALAGLSAAPWLPTLPKQRRHLFEHLKLTPGQKVVDLGCGDGSMLFAVARLHPEVICIGYDISLLPLCIAWVRKFASFRAYRNVHIYFGDLFKQDLHAYDVIFVFLLSKCYPKLVTVLRNSASPNAQIIVEAWPLPNIEPTNTIKAEKLLPMYVYSGQDLRANA